MSARNISCVSTFPKEFFNFPEFLIMIALRNRIWGKNENLNIRLGIHQKKTLRNCEDKD